MTTHKHKNSNWQIETTLQSDGWHTMIVRFQNNGYETLDPVVCRGFGDKVYKTKEAALKFAGKYIDTKLS